MLTPRIPIYLYVLHPDLNARLARLLLEEGYEPVQLDHDLNVDPTQGVVFIETGDDVAHLTQVVNHFYLTYKTESPLPVLAFLSRKALKRNPMLRYWLIDGRPAVVQVVPHKDGCLKKSDREGLLWLLKRLLPLYRG
jgi:hypothetical protein